MGKQENDEQYTLVKFSGSEVRGESAYNYIVIYLCKFYVGLWHKIIIVTIINLS